MNDREELKVDHYKQVADRVIRNIMDYKPSDFDRLTEDMGKVNNDSHKLYNSKL